MKDKYFLRQTKIEKFAASRSALQKKKIKEVI